MSPRAAARERYDAALRKLNAGDVETVRAGIEAVTQIGGESAQSVLIERVQAGLPPALIDPALKALVTLKARRALPVLVELIQHRRPLVRARAIAAIAAIDTRRGGSTQSLLLAALEDPADEVRVAAAVGLGRIGTQGALPALFAAYDRGMGAALPSIAELAGRESVAPLLERMPKGSIEPVLDRMLERHALSAGDQVKLVRGIVASATSNAAPSARSYLLKWLDRVKLDGHPLVKKELFLALKTVDAKSAPKSAPSAAPAEVAAAPTDTTKPAAAPAAAKPAAAKPAAQAVAAPPVLANKDGAP